MLSLEEDIKSDANRLGWMIVLAGQQNGMTARVNLINLLDKLLGEKLEQFKTEDDQWREKDLEMLDTWFNGVYERVMDSVQLIEDRKLVKPSKQALQDRTESYMKLHVLLNRAHMADLEPTKTDNDGLLERPKFMEGRENK